MQFASKYKKSKSYDRAVKWFNIAPFWSIVIFALTPLPFYLAKFLVFSTGYSMPRFMAGIAVGRLPRFYLLALLGHFLKVPAWMIIVLFSGIFAVYLYWIVRAWVRARRTRKVAG
jgi:ribonucleoside-triphosphate reductase